MTAALGVILDPASNTQKFFGGGKCESSSKQESNDLKCHTDDLMCVAMNSEGTMAASGQNGKSPACFTWDAVSGQMKARCKLAPGSRGVNAISISADSSMVALTDNSDDHNIVVFDANSGSLIWKDTGDKNKIWDVCFNAKPGSRNFASVGKGHIKFWDVDAKKCEKGIFGDPSLMTDFACCAYDNEGTLYSGAVNAMIYVWKTKEKPTTMKGAHDKGFICSLRWMNGKLYSGGKDGNVCITETPSMNVLKKINFGVLIRAIDVMGNNALVGLRDGTIYSVDLGSGSKQIVMESHSDGEVWGLAVDGDDTLVTTSDDNKIKAWSASKRKCTSTGVACEQERRVKRAGASTLSEFPDSQCCRGAAINSKSGHVAIGHNDGTMTVRQGKDNLSSIIATKNDSKEWIEVLSYSPDGSMLACGSHDNNIYIYDTSSYNKIGILKAHKSFITCFDWSADSSLIRSVCGAYELLFFKVGEFKQDPSGASNTVDTVWASQTVKFGWCVDGIFPSGTDGSHINGVDTSKDGGLIATGDDYGLVNVFRNPCRQGHRPNTYRGHSEHVVRVKFNQSGSYMFSVGGYDQTVMQWKRQ